jgi:hypothetical protein
MGLEEDVLFPQREAEEGREVHHLSVLDEASVHA